MIGCSFYIEVYRPSAAQNDARLDLYKDLCVVADLRGKPQAGNNGCKELSSYYDLFFGVFSCAPASESAGQSTYEFSADLQSVVLDTI